MTYTDFYATHRALEEERQYMARIASRVPYVTVDSNGTRYCTGCGRPITDRPHRNGYPCRAEVRSS